MKRFACAITAVAVLAAPLLRAASGQQRAAPPDPWLMRVHLMTDEVVREASSLSVYDRALFWARLGELYWREDRESAAQWMLKAVETVESAPDEEREQERQTRLGCVRALMGIIAPREKKLGERLASVLITQSKKVSNNDGALNAGALVTAALAVVEGDPRRAFGLGETAVRAGTSSNLSLLLVQLRWQDDKLSDKLFTVALDKARGTEDAELMRVIGLPAFPTKLWPVPAPESVPLPPDGLRAAWLAVLAEMLTKVQPPEQQAEACRGLMLTASPLLDEYAGLLPAQAGPVRLALTRCQATLGPESSVARRDIENDLSGQPSRTVEQQLRAARDATDTETKLHHLMSAAHDPHAEGQADRALLILEEIDEASRDTGPYGWSTLRWLYAASAAFSHLKRGDRYAMRKTLDAVPAHLRALAVVTFLGHLMNTQDRALSWETKQTLVLELLGEARELLPRVEAAADLRERLALSLVRLYTEFSVTDAPVVFREAVTAMNRAWAAPEPEAEIDVTQKNATYEAWKLIPLPPQLIQADDIGVRQAVLSIESPLKRVQIRLGLLAAALERQRRAAQTRLLKKQEGELP